MCDALSRQFCTLCLAVACVLDLTMHPFVDVFEAGALAEHRLVGLHLAEDWLWLALWNCLAFFLKLATRPRMRRERQTCHGCLLNAKVLQTIMDTQCCCHLN
jgi:hypothetical protein